MADQQLYFKIEGDANGFKKAIADAEAAHKALVSQLTRQQADIGLFRAAQDGLAKTNIALDEARKRLEFFKRSADIGSATGASKYAADIKKASDEVLRLANTARAQKTSLDGLSQGLTASGVNTRNLMAAQVSLNAQVGAANLTLNTRRAALLEQQAAANAAAAATRNFGAASSGSVGDLARMAAEVFAVSQAIKGVKAVIDAGISQQKLNAAFQFSTGSAQLAGESMAFVRGEADRLALPLIEAANGYAKLSAATAGTAIAGEKTRKIFTGVSSAARVLGLESYQVDRAFLAITQALSKGNLQAEEIRGQLSEHVPGAFRILANSLGITEQQLNKDLKAGLVDSQTAMVAFAAELEKMASGTLPVATNSFQAQVVRLQNTWREFLIELANSGVLEAVGNEVVLLTERLREMAETGELQEMAKNLADIIGKLASVLGTATQFAIDHGDAIVNLTLAYAAVRLGGFVKDLLGMVAAFGGANVAATLMTGTVGVLTTAIKAANVALAASPWLALAAGIYYAVSAQADYLEKHKRTLEAEAERERNLRKLKDAVLEAGEAQLKTADEIANATDKQIQKDKQAHEAKQALLKAEGEQARLAFIQAEQSGDKDAQARAKGKYNLYREQFDAMQEAYAAINAEQAKREKNEGFHKEVLKKELEGQTKVVEAALKAQQEAYKKSVSDLESAQKRQKDVLKENAKFAEELNAAIRKGLGEEEKKPSFGDIDSQVQAARRALEAGDFNASGDGIKSARENLKKLAESGEEGGFWIKSLASEIDRLAVRLADVQTKAAEANVEAEKTKLLELQALAKSLEMIKVDVDMESADAAMRKLVEQSQAFLDKNPLVMKVVQQTLEENALGLNGNNTQKRAAGGAVFGPGTGTSDSVLVRMSNNEHVLTAREVALAGGHAAIYRLRAMIRDGLLPQRMPAFANGGALAVGAAYASRLPALTRAASGSSSTINLTLPGMGTYPMQSAPDVAAQLQRAVQREALKRGRR